uniref:hypothetical protein n=1 Tax=Klebsiella pneumoniae TaxID=573 RepID=UPI0013D2C3E2
VMDRSKTRWAGWSDRTAIMGVARAFGLASVLIVSPASQLPASALDLSFISRLFGFGAEAPAETSSVDRVRPRDGRFVVSEADWSTFG